MKTFKAFVLNRSIKLIKNNRKTTPSIAADIRPIKTHA
jgi:hypothetical protein